MEFDPTLEEILLVSGNESAAARCLAEGIWFVGGVTLLQTYQGLKTMTKDNSNGPKPDLHQRRTTARRGGGG